MDEEFETLREQLDELERSCKNLAKFVKMYQVQVMEVLESSHRIGKATKTLIDLSFLIEPDQGTESVVSTSWQNIRRYLSTLADLHISVKETSVSLPQVIDPRISLIQKYIEAVRRRIKVRDYLLLDYDRVYDQLDTLSLSKISGTLTVRQSQTFHRLEKRLELFRTEYDKHNTLLKMELPYFFILICSTIQPMLCLIFYVQITVAYQFDVNLLSLQEEFAIDPEMLNSPQFGELLLSQFCQPNNEIQLLNIVNFHKQYLDQLVTAEPSPVELQQSVLNFDPAYKYCQAMFSFSSTENGDLGINTGDIIKILEANGEWWMGEIEGKEGMFPANYVKGLK